jgi:hypothetical protein
VCYLLRPKNFQADVKPWACVREAPVRISAALAVILSEVLHGFPQDLQACANIVLSNRLPSGVPLSLPTHHS